MAERTNLRTKVLNLILEGGVTNQSLEEALNTTPKTIASTFAQLRLMGKYPVKDENGVFYITDEAGYADYMAAKKATSKSSKKPVRERTPEEKAAALRKSIERAQGDVIRCQRAVEKFDNIPADAEVDELTVMQERVARAKLELAEARVELLTFCESHGEAIDDESAN